MQFTANWDPAQRSGFKYPNIVLKTESDSGNNSYLWKISFHPKGLEDLGDDDIALGLGPHFEGKIWWWSSTETSKCGPSETLLSPRSSSSSKYHEVNKKEEFPL